MRRLYGVACTQRRPTRRHRRRGRPEALGVAILMNGGPGTVQAPRAFEAFQEFTR
jgi:hypothetical protein